MMIININIDKTSETNKIDNNITYFNFLKVDN